MRRTASEAPDAWSAAGVRRRAPRLAVVATLAAVGCGGTAEPPAPGASRGLPPDLRGRRVMVLPVQDRGGVPGTVDPELLFQLRDRAPGVEWIPHEEIEERLERSPGLQAEVRGLPVGVFRSAEVRRIGDPLYGQLRRMAALVDAPVALLPVAVALRAAGSPGEVVARFQAALVDVRTGRVLWFGVEEGRSGPARDAAVLASAVDALARSLLRRSGR